MVHFDLCPFIYFKVENKLKIRVEKFVRKSDGLEIEDEDTYSELLKSREEVWLIALESDEDYGKFYSYIYIC